MDDFAFCHRWHVLCKGEIWARADQSVTHIGLHKFAASYMDAGGGQRVSIQTVQLPKLTNGKGGPGPKVIAGKLAVAPAKGKPAGK